MFPARGAHCCFVPFPNSLKGKKLMMHKRGNEPVVEMYCDWAWEFDILNEKVRRVSIFQDSTKIILQVLVLDTIDEDHLEAISIAHTNFIAQLCHIYVFDEDVIQIADDSEIANHEPLPLRVFKYANGS
jgi:hypothetical protein